MKLNCPNCTAKIQAADMNLNKMIAKCSVCNNLFSIHPPTSPAKTESTFVQRLNAPQPDKVQMIEDFGQLQLRWHWFSWQIILLTIFAIFWNSFMLSFVGGSLIGFLNGDHGFSFLPFLLPHTWVGLGMIYYVATGYVNKTWVDVDEVMLRVKHGPLPWWGQRNLNWREIVQLYTKAHHGNKGRKSYEVHLIMEDNSHKKLLSGLESSELALFVEQRLEQFMGIDDRPVRGEYGR